MDMTSANSGTDWAGTCSHREVRLMGSCLHYVGSIHRNTFLRWTYQGSHCGEYPIFFSWGPIRTINWSLLEKLQGAIKSLSLSTQQHVVELIHHDPPHVEGRAVANLGIFVALLWSSADDTPKLEFQISLGHSGRNDGNIINYFSYPKRHCAHMHVISWVSSWNCLRLIWLISFFQARSCRFDERQKELNTWGKNLEVLDPGLSRKGKGLNLLGKIIQGFVVAGHCGRR